MKLNIINPVFGEFDYLNKNGKGGSLGIQPRAMKRINISQK